MSSFYAAITHWSNPLYPIIRVFAWSLRELKLVSNNHNPKNLIKIAIKHAGNQAIVEFRSPDGEYAETLYLTFDKTKTISGLKKELTKHIKYSTVDSILLHTSPFSRVVDDSIP